MNQNPSPRAFSFRIRSVASLLTLLFGLHGMVPMALAAPLPSALISSADVRAADIASIQLALETKVVQHRLAELGFSPEEIESRIAHASDEELHQLAIHSETVMAGGDGGILVTILVIILLVILIQRIVSVETVTSDALMA
jgi:hypothetical protein